MPSIDRACSTTPSRSSDFSPYCSIASAGTESHARLAFLRPPVSDAPTLALADLWFLPTLRRLILPLLGGTAALLWLASSFHEIPHGHLGLETRLGRAASAPLEPGLHATWPAPFAAVEIVATERLRSVVLGAETDSGKPILWERDHYVGEEARLVGGGEELLTIAVPIFYRIQDPLAYARHTRDPDRLVRDLADQILQAETTRLPAFAIMTGEREPLAAALRARLQAELDRRQSGLAIVLVCLRDIHPPVAVGPAFQDVVSALEDRETYRHEGERLRADALPRARAEADKLRIQADSLLATRTTQATGQAARFTAQLSAYQANPEVFRLRQSYARYDEGMRHAKKLVLAEAFRGRLPATLDVRRTLNPDFAPPLVPVTPELIPSPYADPRLDAFDIAVEGYLSAGRGAIPAIDLAPPNPDHLLDPAAGEARR
ncbi:MAG: protease modulator HflK [Burkholderiales bacterium]|nr:protease modulator HflK [Opitutaceae bacterium]